MSLRNIFSDKRPFYGQDPYVFSYKGIYWLIESQNEDRISISALDDLQNPRRLNTMVLWDDPKERQVWAPEIHNINGDWYIYYTASDGCNTNHRTFVLHSERFLGPYKFCGRVGPDIWGIDMTTFTWQNKRYAVWSGWERNGDEFPQNLYIAEMTSPFTVKDRVKLSVPELDWELSVCPILEGPQVWSYGKLKLLYSANASWKQEYSTGLLTLNGADPLNPDHWMKRASPVMKNAGHGCMLEGYFIYHRKMSTFPGWTDREIKSLFIKEPTWTRIK